VSQVPEWFDQANDYSPHQHEGELYHLPSDLAQRHNLFGTNPAKVTELQERLDLLRARSQVR
ncbi:MAG: arylsulfatase, partial [Planctomycetota bacterium]